MGSGREESDEKENSKKKDGNAPSQDTGGQPPEQVVKEPHHEGSRSNPMPTLGSTQSTSTVKCLPGRPTRRGAKVGKLFFYKHDERYGLSVTRGMFWVPLELVSMSAKGITMRAVSSCSRSEERRVGNEW